MLLHPANFLFILFILISIMMLISTNSWLISWMAMEINLIAFIPMIMKKKNKYTSESALKYFLIQTIASIMIILTILVDQVPYIILMLALALKMAAAPFHQWMPSMALGLTWELLFILTTIQKINPLILTYFLLHTNNYLLYLYLIIIASSIIGSISGLAQSSVRKLMAYSSITHLSWLLTCLLISKPLWVTYYMIYFIMTFILIKYFHTYNIMSINQMLLMNSTSISMMITLSLMSLSGLPPLMGFIPKFMVLHQLTLNQNYFIIMPLLMGTLISLLFYLRLIITNLSLISLTNTMKLNFYLTPNYFFIMNLFGLLFPSIYMAFI